MAAPPSPGSRSPLRVAGIALLGIGVVAAFAGLISTTQGESTGTVAQAPTSSADALEPSGQAALPTAPAASPMPDAGTPAPEATPFVPGDAGAAPSAAPAPAPVEPVAPPSAVAAPPPVVAAPAPVGSGSGSSADGGSGSVVRVPLRVYNNSTIQGLAARAAQDFRNAGWTVADIGSYPRAVIPTSTAYYRPGTDEEAGAREIARVFGLRVEPRFAGIQSSSPGVIVIVTREYESPGKS